MATAKSSAAAGAAVSHPAITEAAASARPQSVRREAAAKGAKVTANYLDRDLLTVGVAVEDLEDFMESSTEELGQFSAGGFLASGSFWLGVERLATVPNVFAGDLLFVVCVVALIAGATIGFFGFRQLQRRQRRIGRIVQAAKSKAASQQL